MSTASVTTASEMYLLANMKARQQLVRMRDSVVTVPEVLVEADYCCNNFSVSHARTHA